MSDERKELKEYKDTDDLDKRMEEWLNDLDKILDFWPNDTEKGIAELKKELAIKERSDETI